MYLKEKIKLQNHILDLDIDLLVYQFSAWWFSARKFAYSLKGKIQFWTIELAKIS